MCAAGNTASETLLPSVNTEKVFVLLCHCNACMFCACCMLPIGHANLYMQVWACAIQIILSGHQLLKKSMQGSVLCLVDLGNVIKDLTVYGSHDAIFQRDCRFGPLCKTRSLLLLWRVRKKVTVRYIQCLTIAAYTWWHYST